METEKIKNDNENIIGKNIRRLRKEKGLGQTDLVKELQLLDIGMTRETLVKIERGIQHIQLAQLKGIKQILDVSYEDLLDWIDNWTYQLIQPKLIEEAKRRGSL